MNDCVCFDDTNQQIWLAQCHFDMNSLNVLHRNQQGCLQYHSVSIWSTIKKAAGQIAVHRTRRPPDSSREDRPGSKRRPGLSRFAVAQYFLGITNTSRAHEMNLN